MIPLIRLKGTLAYGLKFSCYSLITQRIHWIGLGGFDGLKSDGNKNDSKCCSSRNDKCDNSDFCPVDEVILKPFLNYEIAQRPRDEASQN